MSCFLYILFLAIAIKVLSFKTVFGIGLVLFILYVLAALFSD